MGNKAAAGTVVNHPIVERFHAMFDADEGWTDSDSPPEVPLALVEPIALAAFNPFFAIAKVGVKLFVFDKRKPKIDLLQYRDFHQRYAGIALMATWTDAYGKAHKRRMPLSPVWFKAAGASAIDRFEFQPPGPAGFLRPRVWNTSQGFIAPEDGATPEFDRVLAAMLAEAERTFLLDWFADLVQDPLDPPGTILALIGRSQAGKSLLASYLGAMIDTLYSGALHCSALTGHFNAHLEHVLLLHLDEVNEDQTRAFRALFRLVATASQVIIERKGVDKIAVRNIMRLMLTSEDDPFALIDAGDVRRDVLFHARPTLVGDTAGWKAFVRERDNGGPARLLNNLLHRTYDKDRLRVAPITEIARQNLKRNLPPLRQWLTECIEDNRIVRDSESSAVVWGGTHAIDDLHAALIAWWKDRRRRDDVPSREALAGMLRSLGCPYQGRLRSTGKDKAGRWTLLNRNAMAAAIKTKWELDLDLN